MLEAAVAAIIAAGTTVAAVRLLPLLIADEAGLRLLRPASRDGRGAGARRGLVVALLVPALLLSLTALLLVPTGTVAARGLLAAGWGLAAGATPVLAWVDTRIRRLPDRIVLPLALLLALLWVGALLADDGDAAAAVRTALLAGPIAGAALLVLSLLGGRGRGLAIGLGDIKLAVPLGLLAGLSGAAGVLAAFVVAQLTAVADAAWRLAVRREGEGARLAYGPHLLFGMWTGPLVLAALR